MTVRELLAEYDLVLRQADDLSPVVWFRRDRGIAERLPLPRPAMLVRFFALAHVTLSVDELARRCALRDSQSPEQRHGADELAIEDFRRSLPPLRTKTFVTALLIAVIVSAQLIFDLAQAVLPHAAGSSVATIAPTRLLSDLTVPVVTLDVGGIRKLLDVLSAAKAIELLSLALVLILALWAVARLFLGSFHAKRFLFDRYPEVPPRRVELWPPEEHVRGYGGLYAHEVEVLRGLDGRAPREFPLDVVTSASVLLWPIVLGIAGVVYAIRGRGDELLFVGLLFIWISLWRGAWLYRTFRSRDQQRRGLPPLGRTHPLIRFLRVAILVALMCLAVGTASGAGQARAAAVATHAAALSPVPGIGPTARPIGSEPPIEVTTAPALARLARTYQPVLNVSVDDRFWPVSVAAVLLASEGGRRTCVVRPVACSPGMAPASLPDIAGGGAPEHYLDLPPPLVQTKGGRVVDRQFAAFEHGLGATDATIAGWRSNPQALVPEASAQIYFYYGGVHGHYPGAPDGLEALQYWFFYPFNYYPLVVRRKQMLTDPIGATKRNVDYHEGDFEHVTVLLDPRDGQPRYVYMARHADEGVSLAWDGRTGLRRDGTHPIVYGAFGGHPSYPACGDFPRAKLLRVASDYVVCSRGLWTFGPTTPLVDLATVAWRCWPGHFGEAPRALTAFGSTELRLDLFAVAGPRSPLRQAENSHVCK